MRNALSITAVLATFATGAVAEEPTVLDLTEVCADGCIIMIDMTDAMLPHDSTHAGAFKASAVEDPMFHYHGMVTTDSGNTAYRLISEPGVPTFASIALLQEFMRGINNRVIRASS